MKSANISWEDLGKLLWFIGETGHKVYFESAESDRLIIFCPNENRKTTCSNSNDLVNFMESKIN